MEEDTHAGFAYASHSQNFLKCDISNEHCIMDYYENHLKSRIHINNLNRLNNIWNFCDISKDKFNKSCWNKRMKKHADRNFR